MANENLAERLNKDCDISIVASRYLQAAQKNTFVCPKCSSGTGKNGTGMRIDTERNKLHCFKCGVDWSVIDVILHCEHLSNSSSDFIEALKIGCQIYGLYFEENKFVHTTAKDDFDNLDEKEKLAKKTFALIHADIVDAQKHIEDLPLDDRRGLTLSTLKHFGVGYLANWTHPNNRLADEFAVPTRRIIIPTGDCLYHYNAILPKRDRNDSNKKYRAMNAGTKEIFNSAAIVPNKIVIAVEGEFDAMSIFQATGGNVNVIATGGAASRNIEKFFQALDTVERLQYQILILFDADKTGRDNSQKLFNSLTNLNIPATSAFFTDDFSKTDANDVLVNKGVDALKSRVEQIISAAQIEFEHAKKILFSLVNKILPTLQDNEEITTPQTNCTLTNFFATHFDSTVTKYQKFVDRKSGFTNFDNAQILNPGLYILGALPAAGKTTFIWQLLEQFANRGENCVFCSYEMSREFLATKSLARQTFMEDKHSTLSSSDILRGGTSPTMQKILADYKCGKISSTLSVLECSTENVDELISMLKPYCNDTDKPPIFAIDYLQIIPASTDKLTSDKQRLDDVVRKLKIFQRESDATIFLISSFNRMNYNISASFESFKETGNIEYTADTLLALELWKNSNDTSSIRELSMRQPRLIQLKCLKNRFGALYDIFFEYFSRHDYFQPANDFDEVKNTESTNFKR